METPHQGGGLFPENGNAQTIKAEGTTEAEKSGGKQREVGEKLGKTGEKHSLFFLEKKWKGLERTP